MNTISCPHCRQTFFGAPTDEGLCPLCQGELPGSAGARPSATLCGEREIGEAVSKPDRRAPAPNQGLPVEQAHRREPASPTLWGNRHPSLYLGVNILTWVGALLGVYLFFEGLRHIQPGTGPGQGFNSPGIKMMVLAMALLIPWGILWAHRQDMQAERDRIRGK